VVEAKPGSEAGRSSTLGLWTCLCGHGALANDGDPLILGQENVASSTTTVSVRDEPDLVQIFSPSGILNVSTGFGAYGISVTALSGTAISAGGEQIGVIGEGYNQKGVWGTSSLGIGVHGFSEVGTGIKAEATEVNEGTAFEPVGPVKFSTSGLAAIAVSADRATVDPGVPITTQSKVLATLQGKAGNKSMVEHVELNPAAGTFQIILTKPAMRAV
jgi:hypothetical protein